MPEFPARGSRRSKYPFALMAVGESVVIRGVKLAALDGAINTWRKHENILLGKVPLAGDERPTCSACFDGAEFNASQQAASNSRFAALSISDLAQARPNTSHIRFLRNCSLRAGRE